MNYIKITVTALLFIFGAVWYKLGHAQYVTPTDTWIENGNWAITQVAFYAGEDGVEFAGPTIIRVNGKTAFQARTKDACLAGVKHALAALEFDNDQSAYQVAAPELAVVGMWSDTQGYSRPQRLLRLTFLGCTKVKVDHSGSPPKVTVIQSAYPGSSTGGIPTPDDAMRVAKKIGQRVASN